jgi:hypothetical protein
LEEVGDGVTGVFVEVGVSGVLDGVGDIGVLVGGTGVLVGGTGVLVGGTGVLVGGTGVLVGGTVVLVGVFGVLVASHLSGELGLFASTTVGGMKLVNSEAINIAAPMI